ncbi:MAG: hypothetical protein HRT44_10040 [Bdellovibrionales bacterium]|nr:hypothetical protein [Bdellovibrionales bacterium]NQZ19580.1 hypothetical protein [Bdellovibrionales bacterium]
MNKSDAELFIESVYYLKVDELKLSLKQLGLSQKGQKMTLIHSLLKHFKLSPSPQKTLPKRFKKYSGSLSPEKYILPGYYTNGAQSREKLQKIIGPYFKFTTYGMDWIRSHWADGKYPTYQQFAQYWKKEFNRRKEGGTFQSAMTNARVRFFRTQKNKEYSKEKLEGLWAKERLVHKKRVFQLISKYK